MIELIIVNDQVGSPTYTFDLSKLLCDMIVTDKFGTYHATNEGVCSWAEFATEIFKHTRLTFVPLQSVHSANDRRHITRLDGMYAVRLMVLIRLLQLVLIIGCVTAGLVMPHDLHT